MAAKFSDPKIEAILPGVSQVYQDLRSPDYVGIYTSNGELFNHTFFGRDAGMTAKFVCDFDHDVALETIYALAAYQGTSFNKTTNEEPGKIHHEFRDFRTWRGSWFHRIGFYFMRLAWGARDQQLLTYFADDASATYVRLVHKYATRIDKSVLKAVYKDKNSKYQTVAQSIEAAANWIAGNVSQDGLFAAKQSNRLALPFQIFQDSVTAYSWSDGRVADFLAPISYVEAQAYAIDALQDTCQLLPNSSHASSWKQAIDEMRRCLLNDYWDVDKQFFASSISRRDGAMKPLDVPNISAGFTLNNLFWTDVSRAERSQKVAAVVERLFSDEFLTDAGIRTRSKLYPNATKNHIEYHDQHTVWTMFNFMVVEGLRKHRLYRLAEQIEWRLLRAARSIEGYQEFYIVDTEGQLYRPDSSAVQKLSSQMKPERNIAFSVVPLMTIARRQANHPIELQQSDWQAELEQKVLARIRLLDESDISRPIDSQPARLRQAGAGLRAALAVLRRVRR